MTDRIFNDLSSAKALLATRRSGKPRDMVAPGPSDSELREIIATATRVPDHGKLAPWRFVIIPADKRDALAALMQRAYRETKAEPGRIEQEAIDQFAHQAPTLVVVISKPAHASQIPIWEQELSAGAACMNLVTAATAAGYVAGWLTGWAAYSPTVRDALGESDGKIAGFIFIGSPSRPLDERPRPEYDDVVSTWRG
jgi:nitroreductase